MNYLNHEQMKLHTTILGWLFIVEHGLLLLFGVIGFLLMTGIGAASGEPEALAVLSVIGTSAILLFAVLAAPGLAAGYGLLRHKAWGRILAIVMAILGLPAVPIGTAIGIYALWVLFQEAATDYFAAPQPA